MGADLINLDPADLSSLVPQCYATWRPVVAEAVRFFVEHLSERRLEQIVQDQLALPADADISRRLVHFMHRCPALHKLGQVVARNRRLDPQLRTQLQRLESMHPRTPMSQIRPMLDRELAGTRDQYEIQIGDSALAEASVAVVVPCSWRDPSQSADAPRLQAVLKVLKPGVEAELDEDLQIIARLADELDRRADLPPVDYRDVFDDVRLLLLHEVQVEHEQANLRAAAERFANDRDVQIPELLAFSTRHLTAMQRLFGVKVTDASTQARSRRRFLAATIARALVADVVLESASLPQLFHADPHAGNLLATDDGRLGVLDWSLISHVTAQQLSALAQIGLGALTRDVARIARSIDAIAIDPPAEHVVRRHIDRRVAQLPLTTLPGPDWTMRLLDELALAGVRFPAPLLLLRKTYFTLEGVVSDVCADHSLATMLMMATAAQFAREWPTRALRPLDSRDFGTHLSSADLIGACAAAPLGMARQWLDALRSSIDYWSSVPKGSSAGIGAGRAYGAVAS